MKIPTARLWGKTPWGLLWGTAIVVMIGAFVFALLEGFSLGKAIVWGILCGPGWLAIMTIVALVISFFAPQSD